MAEVWCECILSATSEASLTPSRIPGSAKAMAELISCDAPIEQAAEVLARSGLPRAFILKQKRLDDDLNILTMGFDEQDTGLGDRGDGTKAKL